MHQRPLIISVSQTEIGQEGKKIIEVSTRHSRITTRKGEPLSKKLGDAKSCCPSLGYVTQGWESREGNSIFQTEVKNSLSLKTDPEGRGDLEQPSVT